MSKVRFTIVVFFIISVLFCIPLQAATWSSVSGTQCQILDNPDNPVYELDLGYVSSADFGSYGDSSMLEASLHWDVAYFRDKFGADLDVGLIAEGILFLDSADIQLPDQVAIFAFDLGATWRYEKGWAFQTRLYPGIYSDIETLGGGVFYMPFSLAVIKSFSSELSGIAGLELRPRFDQVVMPIVGFEWEPMDELRVSAQLPESKVTWYLDKNWSAYAGFVWNNMSFALKEKGSYDREQLTIEDYRLFMGGGYKLSDRFRLSCELGKVYGRSVEFEESDGGIERKIDVDSAVALTFGLSGLF